MNDFKKILPSLLISVVLVAAIFYYFDVRAMLGKFASANPVYLIAALSLGLVWMIARTFVWRTLLKNKAGVKDTFITLNEGYLLNNVLPFRMGEIGRAFLLSQKTDLKFVEILSTIFIERVTDVAFSAIILLSAIPFLKGVGDMSMIGYFAVSAVMIFFLVAFLSIRYQKQLLGTLSRLLSKFPKIREFVDTTLVRLLQGLDIFSDRKIFGSFIFYMTINWTISIVQYYLIIAAFFPQATIVWGLFALGAAAFGGAIPSLPGGVGTIEGSMGGAILWLSGDKAASLAVPLFLRLNMYLYSGIFGIYGLTTEGWSLRSIYLKLRNMKNSTE